MRPHLTEDEIALFVEGSFNELDRTNAYEHLRGCPQCFEDYKDAAIGRGIWETEREYFGEHPELVSAGLKIAGDNVDGRERSGRNSVRSRSLFGKTRLLAIAACAVILIIAAVWLPKEIGRKDTMPGESTAIQAVLAVAEMASSQSEIVFPGTENSFNPDLPNYRSGIEYDNHLVSSLTELEESNNKGSASRDNLFWLATGFLATRQVAHAKKYINIARAQYPNDTELDVLNALVLFFDGNPDEAEKILRNAHSTHPDDAVSHINLCVVLLEQDKTSEARKLLEDLKKRHPNTRIATRAGKLLAKN